MTLAVPWPWFGAKRDPAPEIWARFGDVPNYVDPFVGSMAVPLARPHTPKTETVNDLDGHLVNVYRSIDADPDAVAYFADWPVSELDLQARHAFLVKRIPWLVDRLGGDPSYCDPRLAGWWIWGTCAWIGGSWCAPGSGPWVESGGFLLNCNEHQALGRAAGVRRRLPHLSAGRGINRQLPHLGNAGQGINRQLPHLGDAGRGRYALSPQGEAVREWLLRLQARLRGMRITCGDWKRVVTPAVTWRHGTTAVFLDPPYTEGEMEYSAGGAGVAAEVAEWCRENGGDSRLRIALCGHEGEHDLPGWSIYRWKARGGYGNAGGEDADDNRHREVIWFSPHCLAARQGSLFEEVAPRSAPGAAAQP